ncbi:MAG: hypothetical protein AAF609_12495 [Cyanobacteria bacterium P01_C01_bin.120]
MSLQDLKTQAMQLPTHERLELIRAIVSSLQTLDVAENWQFLVYRPHPWRRQLVIKGRKLRAATLWQDMIANQMVPEQAAENWNLPLAAVQEVIQYCEAHQDLIRLEAEEEKYRLQAQGVSFESGTAA